MAEAMTLDQQIRADIEARIASGEWPPGHRIPFEHELVKSYGCARATVSKALEKLASAGLIERRRRVGSFVARPNIETAVLVMPDMAQIVAERGQRYRWQLDSVREMRGAGDMGGPVLFITGLHFADGAPFALETRTLSLTAVPEAADEDFAHVSPGSWLRDRTMWTDTRHRIRAAAVLGRESTLLGVESGTACLSVERSTWRAGEAVTQVRQLFPGDRYELIAEFESGTV